MKKALIILALVVMSAVSYAPAQAAEAWHTCSIDLVGTLSDGSSVIVLTDTAGNFTSLNFSFAPTVAKEQLATALTAVSLNKKVSILADHLAPTLQGRIMNALLLNMQQ